MIGYVTLGTSDLERASKYYDKLLGELGAKRVMEGERFISWGTAQDKPSLGLIKPFDGKAASVGNGVMVALAAPSPSDVDRLHHLALELGGSNEGAAGPRGGGFYAGYFRDPDGNKLSFFHFKPE